MDSATVRHLTRVIEAVLRQTGVPVRELADLTQETFAQLLTVLPRFRGDSSLGTFAAGVARFVALRWFGRKRAPGPEIDVDEIEIGYDDEPRQLARFGLWETIENLHDLPYEKRHAVVGYYVQERPLREVGAEAGVAPATMLARAMSGRAELNRLTRRRALCVQGRRDPA